MSGRSGIPLQQNLLRRSNDFANASWTKSALTVSANTIANPVDATVNGSTLVEDSTNTQHFANPASFENTVLSHVYTLSVHAKAATRGFLLITDGGFVSRAYYNLSTGVLGQTSGTSTTTLARTITAVGSGWYRCRWTYVVSGNAGSNIMFILPANADGATSYLGTGSDAIYVYEAQITLGTAVTDIVHTDAAFIGNTGKPPRGRAVGRVAI